MVKYQQNQLRELQQVYQKAITACLNMNKAKNAQKYEFSTARERKEREKAFIDAEGEFMSYAKELAEIIESDKRIARIFSNILVKLDNNYAKNERQIAETMLLYQINRIVFMKHASVNFKRS